MLRECPFCGVRGAPSLVWDLLVEEAQYSCGFSGVNFSVECKQCSCRSPSSPGLVAAIEQWNKRSGETSETVGGEASEVAGCEVDLDGEVEKLVKAAVELGEKLGADKNVRKYPL